MAKAPISIQAIESSCCVNVPERKRYKIYSSWMWILTFLTYCSYHMARKPISVVKNVLDKNCSEVTPPPGTDTNSSHWCNWPPFNEDNASELLGYIDSTFLFTYAAAMFISGMVAERVDLRIYLSTGMVLSGLFCAMFGLGYTFKIHSIWYYILAQFLSGFVSATGWPGVVTALSNWFGKSKRGLIFGLWNIHTSLGNILGTLIASAFVTYNWSLSFVVPGIIIASLGVVVLFFLIPEPAMVGLPNPNAQKEGVATPPLQRRSIPEYATATQEEAAGLLDSEVEQVSYIDKEVEAVSRQREEEAKESAIGFFSALMIPGVIEFSLCLFFAKLVSYTFLYWLPNYIFDNTSFGASVSANLSTFFDVGGMIGGVLAGLLSDSTGMPASTCSVMLVIAIPMMLIYLEFSSINVGVNVFLLIVVGVLVNGPYSLITTAVSADLGTHESLRGSSKALATVSSIIDGTGSIGAAVGPLLAGLLSGSNWNNVFYMLMLSDVFALLLLTRLTTREVRQRLRQRRRNTHSHL
ncbi:hypothetical protein Pmani_006137 [Petrolisthes manimaculis]|uniref:Sugar phosphate exchanger 3 n=1 Tax=Petrolisthes manimaculis TaxID=1843537 RepID=A0AAE1ULF4_9EUCA|nr:hypothetical protein Pmani_006137 [Petrolisthes manimaculis]